MDDEEILDLVAEGELDCDLVDDFRNLDDEIQELVSVGDLSIEEALELDL